MPGKNNTFWDIAALITAHIVLSLILLVAVIAIVFLTHRRLRKYKPVDLAVFDKLQYYTSEKNNTVMLFFAFLGKHQFLIPANLLLIFYFLLINKQSWFPVRVTAIALSSLALMFGLKFLFRRKRPLSPLLKAARGLSFPSGHAIMAVTFYGLIIYIIHHTISAVWLQCVLIAVWIVVIGLVGFSRIYLRVHYTSDVLAGFIIGLIWLFISLEVVERSEIFYKKEVTCKATYQNNRS